MDIPSIFDLAKEFQRTAASEIPVKVRLWDGSVHIAPRRIHKLLSLWSGSASLKAESECAWQLYAGGDLVDVGSYCGWYALLLSPKARPETTFLLSEPDGRALPELYATVSWLQTQFPLIRYMVVPLPLGDGSAAMEEVTETGNFHKRWRSTGVAGGASMATLTLDSLVEFYQIKPEFVKIDVEGAEFSVLRGASRTLEGMPALALEIHSPFFRTPEEETMILRLLSRFEYKLVSELSDEAGVRRTFWQCVTAAEQRRGA